MMRAIKHLIPKPAKSAIRSLYFEACDALNALASRRDALAPPRRLQAVVGEGDFSRAGQKFLNLFIDRGGLKQHHRVLDVGCGVGRMALPLTRFLDEKGSYRGFDVVPECVEWCQKHITVAYPNFQFQTADLFNEMYNPKGQLKAKEFAFPYPNGSFDFVFLTSVFTHTLFEDTDHFLSEISRVLNVGGRCFATFFLLNAEAEELIRQGKSTIAFAHELDQCRVQDVDVPEHAVAFEESLVRALLAKHTLEISHPIYYGRWCGRTDFTVYQDIVISTKPS